MTPPSKEEAVSELVRAAVNVERGEVLLEEAKEVRNAAIRQAAAAGVPIMTITRNAGVSRTWVYEVIG